MENIKIFDNYFSNEEIENCENIVNSNNWLYGHHSNEKNVLSTPFWFMDLSDNDYFTIYLKQKIEKTLKKKLKIKRVYANGQTFGQDGCFHQDDTDKNCITVCSYISPLPDDIFDSVGGNIFFKIPNLSNFSVCLEPLYNRTIVFPSFYFHKGTAFNRYIQNLRICIAWKLEEII